jgi:hypothetical protein
MKKLVLIALAVGMTATVANAGTLSMRWAGQTGNEMTLLPSETARIEIVWRFGALDTKKSGAKLDFIDVEFDAWTDNQGTGSAPVWVGPGVDDYDYSATLVDTVSNTVVTNAVSTYGGTAPSLIGEPIGAFGVGMGATIPIVGDGGLAEFVWGYVDIHCAGLATADPIYIVFNAWQFPYPQVADGVASWTFMWQTPLVTNRQYTLGSGALYGNPGDANAFWNPYHDYETFSPLILHQIPEPSALALLALGGLAMLRRR